MHIQQDVSEWAVAQEEDDQSKIHGLTSFIRKWVFGALSLANDIKHNSVKKAKHIPGAPGRVYVFSRLVEYNTQ